MSAKSLTFFNAMVALERVEPRDNTKKDLLAWSEGRLSFLEGYQKVLLKYILIDGKLLDSKRRKLQILVIDDI